MDKIRFLLRGLRQINLVNKWIDHNLLSNLAYIILSNLFKSTRSMVHHGKHSTSKSGNQMYCVYKNAHSNSAAGMQSFKFLFKTNFLKRYNVI